MIEIRMTNGDIYHTNDFSLEGLHRILNDRSKHRFLIVKSIYYSTKFQDPVSGKGPLDIVKTEKQQTAALNSDQISSIKENT